MRRNYLEFMLRAAGLRCKYHYEGATKVSAGFSTQSYSTAPRDDQGLEDNFHRKLEALFFLLYSLGYKVGDFPSKIAFEFITCVICGIILEEKIPNC